MKMVRCILVVSTLLFCMNFANASDSRWQAAKLAMDCVSGSSGDLCEMGEFTLSPSGIYHVKNTGKEGHLTRWMQRPIDNAADIISSGDLENAELICQEYNGNRWLISAVVSLTLPNGHEVTVLEEMQGKRVCYRGDLDAAMELYIGLAHVAQAGDGSCIISK